MTEPDLSELTAVVVRQPKRSWWRRYRGPELTVSTVEGTPLAEVTNTDDTDFLLAHVSGEFIVRVKKHAGFASMGPVRFHLIDAEDHEVGRVRPSRLVKTRQLGFRTERSRPLFLTRLAHLAIEWQLTETDPLRTPEPESLGRVTVSTVDRWLGLQQYVVETTPRLDTSERQTFIAMVICLHLLRRPPGDSSAPV
ncbi:hypothetical protein [Streptomyces griseoruber]|uniref:Scramblase n=1 Tax=Streptomyces griseoruber TaxID=1943 RepID=A0A101T1W3_9ACTN|nr:hypothetical protein [Streptomyces griseoruber]KUN84219.1 hypothetical protein AQJ64_15775 [Streptomyces griseoruber]